MARLATHHDSFARARGYLDVSFRLRRALAWLQRAMQVNVTCNRTLSLDTGHSPFLSAPEELVRHLVSI